MRIANMALAVAVLALAGCSAAATATPAPPGRPHIVVISEPSQNIPKDKTSHLVAYWSCAPDADPRSWNPYGFHSLPIGTMSRDEYNARRAKWSHAEVGKQLNSLRGDVPCKARRHQHGHDGRGRRRAPANAAAVRDLRPGRHTARSRGSDAPRSRADVSDHRQVTTGG